MVHGIYIKTKPKGKWYLVSLADSAETAARDLENALKKAIKDGNENAEAGIQVFNSSFYIPQMLKQVAKDQPVYN